MGFVDFFKNIFNSFGNWLTENINNIQSVIFALLPDSPFQFELPKEIQEILSYINWLVPFYMVGNTLMVWCGAILVYYAYQTILRWVKSIQ